MKKFLVFLCAMFVCTVQATTVNLNWLVDGTTFAQTTCETGGNLILPSIPPAKYGYTFRGWTLVDEFIIGTVAQNGTPTPNNPIYPTFYENNGMTLRAIGDIADTYNTITGKITRRIGIMVLTGTEYCSIFSGSGRTSVFLVHAANNGGPGAGKPSNNIISNKFSSSTTLSTATMTDMSMFMRGDENLEFFIRYDLYDNDVSAFKSYLATQYTNGTPVTVYYPLAESVEEVWTGQ